MTAVNNAIILTEAYDKYILPLGGKRVPTPYRINIPFQPDRRKYGKSDPETLVKDTLEIAKENNQKLDEMSIEEIRQFMVDNTLGVDCSGFAYHLLNLLLRTIGKESMEDNGFPKASKTNVQVLTSNDFSVPIADLSQTQPGDLIKLNSDQDLLHVLVVLENSDGKITYAHSSEITEVEGVHSDQIINGQFPDELKAFSYNESKGDGVRRLKILA